MTTPSPKPRPRKSGWFVIFLSGVFVLWVIFFAWLALGWFGGGKELAPDLFVDTATDRSAKLRRDLTDHEDSKQAVEEFLRFLSQGKIDESRVAKGFQPPRQLLDSFKRIHDQEGPKVKFTWELNPTSTSSYQVRFGPADFHSQERLNEQQYTGYMFGGDIAFIRENGVMKVSRFVVKIDR